METAIKNKIEHVEHTLEDIRANTAPAWWRTIIHGALYGTGVVLGTILTIAALGWLLSLFGVIPGLGEIVTQLRQIMNATF